MATNQARSHLNAVLPDLFLGKNVKCELKIVQPFSDKVPLHEAEDSSFLALVDRDTYYDPKVKTKHMNVGRGDGRRGFDDCGLPLVLSHNTPNNSIFLLWADPDVYKVIGLFPRMERHRS